MLYGVTKELFCTTDRLKKSFRKKSNKIILFTIMDFFWEGFFFVLWLWCGHLADHLRRELYFGGGGAVAFSSLSPCAPSSSIPPFKPRSFVTGKKRGKMPPSEWNEISIFFSSPSFSGLMIGFSAGDLTRVPVSPGALIEIRRRKIGAFGGIFFVATKLFFCHPPLYLPQLVDNASFGIGSQKNFFGGKTKKELAIERRNIFRAYPQSFFPSR